MNTDKESKDKEQFKFEADMEPLLHLLAHSLYTHKEIYLRELISNSADALSKIRFESLTNTEILKDDTELKISIKFDEEKKTISIHDNGIGMSKEELIANIGTIAHSGTGSFLKNLTGDTKKDAELIGRFGVGFYSVFMVTSHVTVETRHYKSDECYKWESDGKGTYTIEPGDMKERGTRISFEFKKDAEELTSDWSIKSTIRRYSDYIPFPIELNDEKINRSTPIWAKNKKDVTQEEYDDLFKYLSHQDIAPLDHLHITAEAPTQFQSVFFIPNQPDSNQFTPEQKTKTSLYIKKVFIQDDCDGLLPSWLRFVHGVVDSEDLPLNVSREVTQNSPHMTKLNSIFVSKLMSQFSKWAKKDMEKFTKFWKNFGNIIKEGLHNDYTNRDKIIDIFHCYSSKNPDELISLETYVNRMKEGQDEIYYIYGKSKELIENNPNMEIFLKNDIEVLYFYDEIDDVIVPSIGTFKEKQIVQVEKADASKLPNTVEKTKNEEVTDFQKAKLIEFFKEVLKDQVADVVESERLIDNPYTLVVSKDGMNPHMERMMKMMNKDYESAKKILELNMDSPLLVNLCKIRERNAQDAVIKECIEQIYENCLIMDGLLESGANTVIRLNSILSRMTGLYNEASS